MTIVVLLILAGITIALVFSQNGVIRKSQEAKENTKISQVREQLELAKAPEFIEGNGKYNPDSYFQRIEDEGIIDDKDTDVYEREDGTYEVTTTEGYIFIITLVPSKDNVEDIKIEYSGKVDGPRIRKINVTKTTSSISVEVETVNAEGATYTYYYKKNDETDWIKAEENKESTYTFNGLESNVIYNIRVVVEKDGKTAKKEVSTVTGELPEGAVQFSPVTWESGQASTVITTTETGYTLQYQVGGIAEDNWTDATSGTTIENLQHGTTVYGRLFDGTNGSKNSSIDIKDEINPTVTVSKGTITTNSISVNVQVIDSESGMITTPTYTYYIKENGETDSSYKSPAGAIEITQNTYTFTGLTQETSYDVKVEVNGDEAGNIGIGILENQTTGIVGGASEGLLTGNIIASNPTWSNGKASITLSTSTGLTIQYQVDGIAEENWKNGTNVTELQHGQTVYARLTDGINYGNYASMEIRDAIPPSIPTLNTNGYVSDTWTTNNITLVFNSVDNETGVLKYQWSPDGVNIYDVTNPYIWTENTRTGFYIRAVDHVGNCSNWGGGIIISKDSLAPNTFNISIDNVTNDSFTIHASTSDAGHAGINRYEYIVNGVVKYSGTNTSFNVTGLQSGVTYQVYVNCYDNAGNMTRSSNTLNQQLKLKWSAYADKSSAKVTLREPSSDASPTVLEIISSSEQFVRAGVLCSGFVPSGTEIRVDYMYVRSNTGAYLDFLFNETPMEVLSYSKNNTRRSYTYTTKENLNSIIFGLNKSNITSPSYYATLYIYGIYMNNQKVL